MEIRNKPYIISFYNHPSTVKDIPINYDVLLSIESLQRVKDNMVYITVPQQAPSTIAIAGVQLGRILGDKNDIYNLHVKAALQGVAKDQKTCDDANNKTMIILFTQTPTNLVTMDRNNCVIVGATTADEAITVTDALGYRLLGVIPSSKPAPQAQLNITIPTNNS